MDRVDACGASDEGSNPSEGAMNLFTPIEQVPRVGERYQKKLNKLGIRTIANLLFHFPHRYEDFSNIIPIKDIQEGETVCVRGKITKIENIMTWKKRIVVTTATIEDEYGKNYSS